MSRRVYEVARVAPTNAKTQAIQPAMSISITVQVDEDVVTDLDAATVVVEHLAFGIEFDEDT